MIALLLVAVFPAIFRAYLHYHVTFASNFSTSEHVPAPLPSPSDINVTLPKEGDALRLSEKES